MLERLLWVAPAAAIIICLVLIPIRYFELRNELTKHARRGRIAWAVLSSLELAVVFLFLMIGLGLGIGTQDDIGKVLGIILGLISGVAATKILMPVPTPAMMRWLKV